MARCTKDRPCLACAAGIEKQSARRTDRDAPASPARPSFGQAPRRFMFWDDVMCRASLLPRAYCAGCEHGHHDGEAWR